MKVFRWFAAALLLALLACNTQAGTPLVFTFNRPQRVAFACFDLAPTAAHRVWPTDACKPAPADAGVPDDAGAADKPITPTLHALVTQSDRGEVAAVDLVAPRTQVTVIDSRTDIPGTTFLPAGELPGPIIVPPKHPGLTYIANAGSHDISVLRTSAFRSLEVGQNATVQRVRLRVGDAENAAAPLDMVLGPDEDALFVSAPASGLLLRVPLQRCDSVPDDAKADCHEGHIDAEHIASIPLATSLSKAQAVAPPMGDESEPYHLICRPAWVLPVPMARTQAVPTVPANTPPEPAGLAVDAFCRNDGSECKRRLLVADKRWPLIHVVDLDNLGAMPGDGAVLQPIVTGVPTSKVVVTPRVPVSIDSDDETQYIYAIDVTDGSVLAMRDGRVINVAPERAQRQDRLDLGLTAVGRSVALSLGVLTPEFDVNGPAAQWVTEKGAADKEPNQALCLDQTHTTRSPVRLRGVFLAVGLSDGSVRFVDVHDMELRVCRECDRTDPVSRDDAGRPTTPVDSDAMMSSMPDPYPVVRNRTRIGYVYDPTRQTTVPPRGPFVVPQFEIGPTFVTISSNGATLDPRIAGLDCVTCPAVQSVSFPYDSLLLPDAGVAAGSGGESGGQGSASEASAGRGGMGGAGGMSASDAGAPDEMPATAAQCAAGQGRVCSMQDPWLTPVEWVALYEGAILGSRGGRGRFVDSDSADNHSGSLEFAGEIRFCNAGVLGADDIGEDRSGDQVQITSALPNEFADRMKKDPALRGDCETLIRARDQEKTPIAFRIKRAYSDRLVIDGALINPPHGLRSHPDYDLVRSCFLDMLVGYEIHVSESYAVSSVTANFLHRVIADPTDQRCKNDVNQSPTRTARAYEDVQFDNGMISFKLKSGKSVPAFGTLLRLHSDDSNTPKVLLDAHVDASSNISGVTPVDLQFCPINQMFYVIDVTSRGLIPVAAASVSTGLTPYQ